MALVGVHEKLAVVSSAQFQRRLRDAIEQLEKNVHVNICARQTILVALDAMGHSTRLLREFAVLHTTKYIQPNTRIAIVKALSGSIQPEMYRIRGAECDEDSEARILFNVLCPAKHDIDSDLRKIFDMLQICVYSFDSNSLRLEGELSTQEFKERFDGAFRTTFPEYDPRDFWRFASYTGGASRATAIYEHC